MWKYSLEYKHQITLEPTAELYIEVSNQWIFDAFFIVQLLVAM